MKVYMAVKMRKLLNVLYVTTPEAYLTRDGENIVIKVEDEEKFTSDTGVRAMPCLECARKKAFVLHF